MQDGMFVTSLLHLHGLLRWMVYADIAWSLHFDGPRSLTFNLGRHALAVPDCVRHLRAACHWNQQSQLAQALGFHGEVQTIPCRSQMDA